MPDENRMIKRRIITIMNDLNLTQSQLAKALNITQPAVSKYLQGRIPPPVVLLELSRLCGKSIEWILTGEEYSENRKLKVAENVAHYSTVNDLESKISRLPEPIRKQVEALISSILEYHK